jgi:hypothetical protein
LHRKEGVASAQGRSRNPSAHPQYCVRGGYGYALDGDRKSGRLRFIVTLPMPMPVLLTFVPMILAMLGGAVDQYTHLGFTLWRDACRSAGLTVGALCTFTLELLPMAVVGLLLGGLVVLAVGWLNRAEPCAARASLATHAGCALGMAVGMLLCTLFLSPLVMLIVEPVLAVAVSIWLLRASVSPRTSMLPSA